jgi:hypothetical protein
MRIDRISLEGFGRLDGSFELPQSGLAVWASPNETGKTTLGRAILDALYGVDSFAVRRTRSSEAATATPCVTLGFTLAGGTSLTLHRDLASNELRLTLPTGEDVTSRFATPNQDGEPGSSLLGRTRAELEATRFINSDLLRRTPGDPELRRMLEGRPRGASESRAELSRSATSFDRAELRTGEIDLLAFPESSGEPSPFETPPGELHLDIEGGLTIVRTSSEASRDILTPGSGESSSEDTQRLREMQRRLDALEAQMRAGRAELLRSSETHRERRAEFDRLKALAGAEPSDLERLQELLEEIGRAQSECDAVRAQLTEYHGSVKQRGLVPEQILELDALFRTFSEEERSFLEGYLHEQTVQRGNLTVARSESRLEESELDKISIRRKKIARLALPFLLASAVALTATTTLAVLRPLGGSHAILFVVGLIAASVASAILYHSRNVAEPERRRLVKSIQKRRGQIEELEKQGKYGLGRLGVLAEEHGFEGDTQLLDGFRDWKARSVEIAALHRFERDRLAAEKHLMETRQRVGTYQMATEPTIDLSSATVSSGESVYREYTRFFEVQEELAVAEASTSRVEQELAELETQRASLDERVASILRGAGIDPSRDRDEAVELYARRSAEGSLPPLDVIDLGLPPVAAAKDVPASRGAAWASRISARTEAILRRFVPEAYRVEIGEDLLPTLKLEPRGPRLQIRELEQRLSASSFDQLCLALRIAIVETLSADGEDFPLLLDEPLARADDARFEATLDFLVSDASTRNQVVFLTAQEVRLKWFLERFPQHRNRVASIRGTAAGAPRSRSTAPKEPTRVF